MHLALLVRWLVNGFLAVAILALVVFGLGPQTGAYRTLSILSDSMQPTFGSGDVVVVRPVRSESLRAGDVITYQAPIEGNPVVTHRVVKVAEPGARPLVQTKGDASTTSDPWSVRLDEGTVWRHAATIPAAGHVIRALRHERIRPLTLHVLPLLLLVMMLVAVWRVEDADGQPAEHVDMDELDSFADVDDFDRLLAEWRELQFEELAA